MKHLRLWVVLAAIFYCSAALAQNAGTVTSHAFAVGKGAAQQGFTSILCASAQIAVGQSAADPICRSLTGDVTISSAGVTAIGANKVTLGMHATLAADSVIGNFTGSGATPTAQAFPNCTGALIYSTSTHVLGCNVSGGTGTVTSVAAGTGLTASPGPIVATGTVSCNQATNAAFGCVEVDNTTIKATAGVISLVNQPAMVLLNTLTASNSATLSDTSSFTATYSAYELVFENLLPATNNSSCAIQVQSGGIFQTTSYVSPSAYFSTTATAFTAPTTFIPCSAPASVPNAGSGVNGSIRVNTPWTTIFPKGWYGQLMLQGTNCCSISAAGWWGGGNGAVTGFQVSMSGGNITSGVIKIYGIQ